MSQMSDIELGLLKIGLAFVALFTTVLTGCIVGLRQLGPEPEDDVPGSQKKES